MQQQQERTYLHQNSLKRRESWMLHYHGIRVGDCTRTENKLLLRTSSNIHLDPPSIIPIRANGHQKNHRKHSHCCCRRHIVVTSNFPKKKGIWECFGSMCVLASYNGFHELGRRLEKIVIGFCCCFFWDWVHSIWTRIISETVQCSEQVFFMVGCVLLKVVTVVETSDLADPWQPKVTRNWFPPLRS